jgi:hypothetical protein
MRETQKGETAIPVTFHVSRFTFHVSRFTFHVSRPSQLRQRIGHRAASRLISEVIIQWKLILTTDEHG